MRKDCRGIDEMTEEIELVHGSGNVFQAMGLASPIAEKLKAIPATKIEVVLDSQNISVRRAHDMTGFAAADFLCVRQAKLERFTVDRLNAKLDRLDRDVEVTVRVQQRGGALPNVLRAA